MTISVLFMNDTNVLETGNCPNDHVRMRCQLTNVSHYIILHNLYEYWHLIRYYALELYIYIRIFTYVCNAYYISILKNSILLNMCCVIKRSVSMHKIHFAHTCTHVYKHTSYLFTFIIYNIYNYSVNVWL